MNLPTMDEVIDADRARLKHYCKLYGLPTRGKNRYLRSRLFELIRLGREREEGLTEAEGLSRLRRFILLASRGENERATDEISGCIEHCPESAISLTARSLILQIEGRGEDALRDSDRAMGIEHSADVLLGRTLLLMDAGMFREAEESADMLARIMDGPVAWVLKAVIAVAMGKEGLAVQHLDRVIEIDDNLPELWNMKGEIMVRLGNHGNALPCFDKAISLRARYAEAHNNKGVALLHLGHVDDAIRCFEKALKARPTYYDALGNKAIALYIGEKVEEALECIDRVLKVEETGAMLSNKGYMLLSSGRFEEALASFERALEMYPDIVEARRGREMALERMEERKRAEETLASPTDVQAFLRAGEMGPS